MALYSNLASLSQTAGSNASAGAVDAPSTIDEQLNLLASFIAQLRDGVGFTANGQGRLLRTLAYVKIAGVQNVIVNGASPTTTGATTYTPSATMAFVRAEVQGGGGAGGGGNNPTAGTVSVGAPGSSGAYGVSIFTAATIVAPQTITVGAGGVGNAGSTGATGSTSSIGSLLLSPGGPGGATLNSQSVPIVFGTAGTASPTGANLHSAAGFAGIYTTAFSAALGAMWGGPGGSSVYGQGAPQVAGNTNGAAGNAPGTGGSGVALITGGGTGTGGAGAPGMVIIYEYA